jgi:putative endonuclease
MYFVYVLRCKDGSLYTGITTDLARRLAMHKAGTASRYTRAKGVGKMLYSEKQPSRSAASKREAEIKKWPRTRKLALCRYAGARYIDIYA